jgi:hypothetical protein
VIRLRFKQVEYHYRLFTIFKPVEQIHSECRLRFKIVISLSSYQFLGRSLLRERAISRQAKSEESFYRVSGETAGGVEADATLAPPWEIFSLGPF